MRNGWSPQASGRWSVTRVSGPPAEVLTTTEAKAHLRVQHSDEDTYIDGLVQGAREWLEEQTNNTFVRTTLDYFADYWPDGRHPIELPRGPLLSVTTVKYTTTTSTTAQTLSATTYIVDTKSEVPRVALKEGETWPTDDLRDVNGVEVRYVAGYATASTNSSVPEQVKTAAKLIVGHWYTTREAVIVGSANTPTELAVRSLMTNFDKRRYM